MQISSISSRSYIPVSFKNASVRLIHFNGPMQTSDSKPLDPFKIKVEQEGLQLFFNTYAEKTTNVYEKFFDAIKGKDVKEVTKMIQAGILDDDSKIKGKALDLSINTSSEIVDLLLKSGVKVTDLISVADLDTLWRRACLSGKSCFLVKELLKNGLMSVHQSGYDFANCYYGDSDCNTPLSLAIKTMNMPLLELLLKNRAKPSTDLIELMYKKYNSENRQEDDFIKISITSKLLEYDLNPNGLLSNDFSLLYLAIDQGNLELIKLFLEKGANINAVRQEISPLYYALGEERYNSDVVKLLLNYRVTPKRLTKIEKDFITDFRQRMQDQDEIILKLLSAHNPEVKEVFEGIENKGNRE